MNIYKQLIDLLPSQRVDVGTVLQVYADAVLVLLQTGGKVRAIGTGTVNERVYIKNGVVIGVAPNLSGTVIEV